MDVQILQTGLELCGFVIRGALDSDLNMRRFRSVYGSSPETIENIWNDLLATPIDEARIDPGKFTLDELLIGMFWLRQYTSEHLTAAMFGIEETRARQYAWNTAKKLQALKAEKVCSIVLQCVLLAAL